jgi:hypothetical protein
VAKRCADTSIAHLGTEAARQAGTDREPPPLTNEHADRQTLEELAAVAVRRGLPDSTSPDRRRNPQRDTGAGAR